MYIHKSNESCICTRSEPLTYFIAQETQVNSKQYATQIVKILANKCVDVQSILSNNN